jgi:hypothetical protein
LKYSHIIVYYDYGFNDMRIAIYIILLSMFSSLFTGIDLGENRCNCHMRNNSVHVDNNDIYKFNISTEIVLSKSCCCNNKICFKNIDEPLLYIIPDFIISEISKNLLKQNDYYGIKSYKIFNSLKIRAGPQELLLKSRKIVSLYLINMSFLC